MPRTYSDEEARNREVALAFYDAAIINWNYEAAVQYVGATYLQHTPTVGDGREGLRAFIEGVPPPVREMLKTEVRRTLVDGDMVAIHSLHAFGDMRRVIVDLFRLEDGKIVEHWDVVQEVEPSTLHGNPPA